MQDRARGTERPSRSIPGKWQGENPAAGQGEEEEGSAGSPAPPAAQTEPGGSTRSLLPKKAALCFPKSCSLLPKKHEAVDLRDMQAAKAVILKETWQPGIAVTPTAVLWRLSEGKVEQNSPFSLENFLKNRRLARVSLQPVPLLPASQLSQCLVLPLKFLCLEPSACHKIPLK